MSNHRWSAAALLPLLWACSPGAQSTLGEETSPCNDGLCLQGLECRADRCIDPDASDTDGGSTSDAGSTEATTTEETGAGLTLCSLQAINADVESPVDAADEAGKIPAVVGAALERNCGCHYTSNAPPPYTPFSGGTQLQTLANFTGGYAGANSLYAGQPAWRAVQDRVINQRNMPTAVCQTEEGTNITAADFALFEAWFEQEAPDGASFDPPG